MTPTKESRERGYRLKTARKQMKMTQQALADKLNKRRVQHGGQVIERNAVSMWETGRNLMPADCLLYAAELLNKTPQWLLLGKGPESLSDIEKLIAAKNIPLLSYEQVGTDNPEATFYIGIDTVLASIISEDSFALQVKDKSMLPALKPGDIIILDPMAYPHPGEIIIVKLNQSRKLILGKYRPRENNLNNDITAFEVVPINSDWPSTAIESEAQGKIIGTLVEHRCRRRLPFSDIAHHSPPTDRSYELVAD